MTRERTNAPATASPAAAPGSAPASRGSARLAAAFVAAVAWGGLAAGCFAVFGRTGSVGQTLWVMSAYFTNTTSLLVALLFTALALGLPSAGRASPTAAAGLMVVLVGIVQRLLLHGLRALHGADAVADAALHVALPVLVPLFWLAFEPKGRLRHRDPWVWALYPLAYLAWALVRGALHGRAIYPFLDPSPAGWPAVLATVAAITAGFLLVGALVVILDGRLAARSGVSVTDR